MEEYLIQSGKRSPNLEKKVIFIACLKLLKSQKKSKVKRSGLIRLLIYLRQRFDLEEGKEDELETIEYISKNVEFKGANLWILIFAILVASVGLNVNSTAVIIGAMLISPLMGPIMGIGLAAGINDFELLKKSIRNLLVAIFIAILTSTVYFTITPIYGLNQSYSPGQNLPFGMF